ncbi:EI24 domain-containing protein [Cupriavidus sp. 2TAF22]|uniref:EI24 domain-containing protein n=1 Tax=unclassified Cupriavidus TaxID=2640874 RepID=UPI003F92E721
MNDIFRAFGRALMSQLHPRMLMLTVIPFVLATGLWGGLLLWGWEPIMATARGILESSALTSWIYAGLAWLGMQSLNAVVAPLFVIALMVPLVIASMLIFISLFSVPSVMRHLERSYPGLERAKGGSVAGSVLQTLGSTFLFLLLVIVTLPLWLFPLFFALIPPLLWGWLTYRVMTYDALAEHATAEERKTLMKRHRASLLSIGVAVGLLGSAPTLIWVSSAALIFLFPFVLAGTLWLYVLIFIFSALWFGHFCLRALEQLRAERAAVAASPAADVIDLAPSDVRRIEQS